MKVTPQTMKSKQRPRARGSWVCEFNGLGLLPVLHTKYLDMKSRTYFQPKKGELRAAKFSSLLEAFEMSGGLVAIQNDHHTNPAHSFVGWWGILKCDDLSVTDDGTLSLRVVDRLREWP